MNAIRTGFFSMVKMEDLEGAGVVAEDLGEIICGVDWGREEDFDFRDIFQVVCDEEVRAKWGEKRGAKQAGLLRHNKHA